MSEIAVGKIQGAITEEEVDEVYAKESGDTSDTKYVFYCTIGYRYVLNVNVVSSTV